MSAEDWERVKAVFSAALELPKAGRDAYIAAACSDRPDLRQMVEELLANHWISSSAPRSQHRWTPLFSSGDLVADRYRIIRPIARGGMGEVYEAHDERLRFRLALKTLRLELMSDRTALARLQRELLIAREVAHENVCHLFDFVEHLRDGNSIPCLTMELLVGDSLADYLVNGRPLNPDAAMPLIREIASAMVTLHERGIVHRDLKPSNVMLARRGNRPMQAVVTDFGLAKMSNSSSDLFESQLDAQAGAPYFMAPELLRCEKPSIASDIYSFGLLIDEMVTSTRAFSAESLQSLYFAKLWETPKPPRDRAKNLPPHWNDVILRCLDQDPRRRYQSIEDVVCQLESPGSMAPIYPLSRRSLIAVGGGVAALAAGAALRHALTPAAPIRLGVFDIENRTESHFDYICRGTIAELMRRLGTLEGVEVMRLYTNRRRASLAGQQFGLDGSLVDEGGKLRLTMQLLDGSSQDILWSGRFTRPLGHPIGTALVTNLLELQSEIARQTVAALEGALGIAFRANSMVRRWWRGVAFAAQSPTVSDVAFDHFLRGQTLLQESSPASIPAAVECFERAVAEDARFALAYAALAQAHLSWLNFDQDRAEEFGRQARMYAERALQEAPQLAEAHAVLAAVLQHEWNWRAAEESYNAALELKPRFPRALRWRAGLVLQFGRFVEAIQAMDAARSLDPYDRTSISGHGLTLLFAGRVPDAIALLEKSIIGRDMIGARFNLSQAYARHAYLLANSDSAAFYAKALQQAQIVAETEERAHLSTQMFALIHSLRGDRSSAAPHIRLLERAVYEHGFSPVRLAWMYAVQNDIERALGLLERALIQRDSSLIYVKVNPFLENLRKHPRFEAIVTAMHLT